MEDEAEPDEFLYHLPPQDGIVDGVTSTSRVSSTDVVQLEPQKDQGEAAVDKQSTLMPPDPAVVDLDDSTESDGVVHADPSEEELANGNDEEAEWKALQTEILQFQELLQSEQRQQQTEEVTYDNGIDTVASVAAKRSLWKRQKSNDNESTFVPVDLATLDIDDKDVNAAVFYHVLPYQNGVYRGQVLQFPSSSSSEAKEVNEGAQREEDNLDVQGQDPEHESTPSQPPNIAPSPSVYVPHGYGTLFYPHDGSCRSGEWQYGQQIDMGIQQHVLLTYEGEWLNDQPNGYGVGVFIFGSAFAGKWNDGIPCGMGRFQHLYVPNNVKSDVMASVQQLGWFRGSICVQPCSNRTEMTLFNCITANDRVPAEFHDQPLRGLFVACMSLENARLKAFQRALDRWRRACVDDAIERAHKRRLLAFIAWQKAHVAQEKAIETNLDLHKQEQQQFETHVVEEIAIAREKHARRLETRRFHESVRETAEFQCELARCCMETEQHSVHAMEKELGSVRTLLNEANQAQANCQQWSRNLHLLKRQIENISVKINHLHQQIYLQDAQQTENPLNMTFSSTTGSRATTPSSLKYASSDDLYIRRGSQVGNDRRSSHTTMALPITHPEFACDVAGCSCGIPRDVFSRVAATLNGEE